MSILKIKSFFINFTRYLIKIKIKIRVRDIRLNKNRNTFIYRINFLLIFRNSLKYNKLYTILFKY